TPGTVTDTALLEERQDTLVAAVARDGGRFGLAWLDLAAGRFTVLQGEGRQGLAGELERLRPAELLQAEGAGDEPVTPSGTALRTRPPWHFELASASRLLTDQLGTLDLRVFGADELPLAIAAVGALIEARAFDAVRRHLKGVGDVERILARVALRSAPPRDLTQLRSSLTALPALRAALVALDAPLLEQLRARMHEHQDVVALLAAAIAAEPAALVRDGEVIAAGYDPELDELRRIATHTDEFLLELERRERE